LLLEHLIKKHNPELNRNFIGADDDVLRILIALPWKGNVRELDNVIEHTMILAEGDVIAMGRICPAFTYSLKEATREFEKQHIRRVLDQTEQDRKEAAKLLEISLSSLCRKSRSSGSNKRRSTRDSAWHLNCGAEDYAAGSSLRSCPAREAGRGRHRDAGSGFLPG
jgi:DNA-binding NtrC family response regulator